MTLNNDQISTVLLLIETSQLPEPELSEAWDLLNFIQKAKMIETNYPVCSGCDCVNGCSKVKDKDCIAAPVLALGFQLDESCQNLPVTDGDFVMTNCTVNENNGPYGVLVTSQPIKQGDAK